jgi:hypothetical protein
MHFAPRWAGDCQTVPVVGPRRSEPRGLMNEGQFTRTVVDIGRTYHWRVSHFRPALTEKGWRTPVQGDKGFPDLVLARNNVVIIAELKVGRGKLTPDQELWRDALGEVYRLWRPVDIPTIISELR